jgi:hypothetical protein
METEKPLALTETAAPPPKEPGKAALVAIGSSGIMLRSLEDLIRFARLIVEDGAAPKGMTVGAAAIAIQAGLERGLGPLGGMQYGTVINGRFAWNGQGAYSLIQNSKVCKPGTLKAWTDGEGENMVGIATAWRVGYAEPDVRKFTVKDARAAGLWGKDGPWKQYTARQMKWRALGFLARDVFPDVLGGFALAEEAVDFEEAAPLPRTPIAELPPPPMPDPLLSLISGEESPPFASHEEADRDLAAEETREQRGLFGGAE